MALLLDRLFGPTLMQNPEDAAAVFLNIEPTECCQTFKVVIIHLIIYFITLHV
jgi:hypothetical protein